MNKIFSFFEAIGEGLFVILASILMIVFGIIMVGVMVVLSIAFLPIALILAVFGLAAAMFCVPRVKFTIVETTEKIKELDAKREASEPLP
jgi:hypothetical protein